MISTSPSLAAGVPADAVDADKGALIAFMGQVPVRCVGPVAVAAGAYHSVALTKLRSDGRRRARTC